MNMDGTLSEFTCASNGGYNSVLSSVTGSTPQTVTSDFQILRVNLSSNYTVKVVTASFCVASVGQNLRGKK